MTGGDLLLLAVSQGITDLPKAHSPHPVETMSYLQLCPSWRLEPQNKFFWGKCRVSHAAGQKTPLRNTWTRAFCCTCKVEGLAWGGELMKPPTPLQPKMQLSRYHPLGITPALKHSRSSTCWCSWSERWTHHSCRTIVQRKNHKQDETGWRTMPIPPPVIRQCHESLQIKIKESRLHRKLLQLRAKSCCIFCNFNQNKPNNVMLAEELLSCSWLNHELPTHPHHQLLGEISIFWESTWREGDQNMGL